MKNIRNSFLTGIMVSLIAAPVFASGPLNLNPNDPDNLERWAGGGADIPWNPDQGGLGPLNNAQAVAMTAAAYDEWETVATATATYSNNGSMPFDVDVTNFAPFIDNLFFGNNTSDGLSPIVYDEDGSIFLALFGPSGVLGFASPDTRDGNGVPIEGVSFLNGGAILGGFPVADFFGVMVHEFGHFSGMAHTVTNGQNILLGDESGPTPFNTYGNAPLIQMETMYPFIIVGGGQATLHADDIGFYSTMYPAAGFFGGSGTISGTILAPNGTTPLTGVNVIARNVADPFADAVSAISGDRGVTGEYTINGLTPGADYTIHIDQILQGGFSTPPIAFVEPEEFYNGVDESNNAVTTDDPADATNILAVAGAPVAGVDVIFNTFAPGDPLPVGDDGFFELFMPFSYSICGQDFDSVFVNANGNLTFGSGSSDFSESSSEMLSGPPRIAGLWDDLNPSAGGIVTFDQSENSFTVIYDDIPEFFATGSNSFEITLSRSSDHIDIEYGDISAADGLAGISCGGAVTSGFEAGEDLSAAMAALDAGDRLNLQRSPARYELFDGGNPNDTTNSLILFNSSHNYNDSWAGKNDSLDKARNIKLPFDSKDVVRFTEIEPAGGDVDYYRFKAQANTTFAAEILTGQLDTVMGLFDPSGVLIAFDDDGGSGLLSKLVVPITADGNYTIAVSTFADFDFEGDGFSGGRYVLDAFAINGFLLSLGDDDSEEVSLGFDFPFNGTDYSSVFVNSNGNLTFGAGDTDFSESVGEFLAGEPRIAPLWDDLSPNNGGTISVEFGAGEATVIFDSVPEFFNTGANTFMVTMRVDGSYTIEYDAISATDGLAGTTEGGGAADPGETDLSAGGPYPKAGTTYENFSGGDNDLAGDTLEFDQ